ncbi:hypothetical protein [Burkholderia sp. Ax-1719]|nr:hypothetical protein [Burkholderia sp. Ax-1719]
MSPSPLIDLTRLQQIPASASSSRVSAFALAIAFFRRWLGK